MLDAEVRGRLGKLTILLFSKRIALFLVDDRCVRSVAREYSCLLGESVEVFLDRLDQLVVIAAWEVGAAD